MTITNADLTHGTHLQQTRGGSQCGRPGRTEADINEVTCPDCLTQHDQITNEGQAPCPKCNGAGLLMHDYWSADHCRTCGGTGTA